MAELLPHPRPPLPDLERGAQQFQEDVQGFRRVCLNEAIWIMWAPPKARRLIYIDIDMEDIRHYYNGHNDPDDHVNIDVFKHMVARCPDLWV